MANLITLSRLLLLIIILVFLYSGIYFRITAFFLIIFLFLMDCVDGIVARRTNNVSDLGSLLDIAMDRVVESALWIIYADIGVAPVWAPVVVVSRGIITDSIRGYALSRGMRPFEMMRTPVGRFLVSSRFMRALYGTAKAVVFCLLTLILIAIPLLRDSIYKGWISPLRTLGDVCVAFVVFLCVLRGIPVILEARFFLFGREKYGSVSDMQGHEK